MTQISLCIFVSVLRKKKNKLNVDGIISSSDPDAKVKLKDVNGSFYLEMMLLVNKNIKQNGDWLWMKDSLNGECLMASEVESISKRYDSYVYYINARFF